MEKRNILTIGFLLISCAVFLVVYRGTNLFQRLGEEKEVMRVNAESDSIQLKKTQTEDMKESFENSDSDITLKDKDTKDCTDSDSANTSGLDNQTASETKSNMDSTDRTDSSEDMIGIMNEGNIAGHEESEVTEEDITFEPFMVTVIPYALNIRNQPLKDATVIDIVEKGTILQVTEPEQLGWYKVQHNDKEGYICVEFVE